MFAWGANNFGELGVGDTKDRVVPTLVTGLLETKSVVQITAGNISVRTWLPANLRGGRTLS